MLTFHTYKLPFQKSFKISSKTFHNREGIIGAWKQESEETFYSEAAPLHGFSPETLEEICDHLKNHGKDLAAILNDDSDESIKKHFPQASLRFLLDNLRMQRIAFDQDMPFYSYLNSSSSDSVAINATIGIQSMDEALSALLKKMDEGFSTFKLKVGQNFDAEFQLIEAIRKNAPDISIRIDANGAWDTKSAIAHLKALQQFNISYCEQPIAPGNEEDFKIIEEETGVAVAADESIRTNQDCRKIISEELCKYLILKPMFIGCASDMNTIAKMAKENNIGITITSALDSGIGRNLAAHYASAFGSKTAHGLATGSLFLKDLFSDQIQIKNGNYKLDTNIPLFSDTAINNEPLIQRIL